MSGEEQFLRKHFQSFYLQHQIAGPQEIEAREFGYGVFGRKIANRNKAFASVKAFNDFLRTQVPFFVSYSSALYKFPDRRPMEAKELFAADLVYEFDADDLPTECKQRHDSWQCPKCRKEGKGRQLNCDECGSATKLEEWFCPLCLEATKQRVFALIDFLEEDFGFNEGISINFSGRAGYHVHVRNELVRKLSQTARLELIDYLSGMANPFSHFEKKETYFTLRTKLEGRVGWPNRVVFELIRLLEEGNAERISIMGNISVSDAKKLLRKKDIIIESIKSRGVIPALFGRVSSAKETKSDVFWGNFLSAIFGKLAPIDRQTSVDLNKIVRVPETLHGETGLVSREVALGSLKEFNPFDDAVAFQEKETVRVFISKAPSIYLAGQRFGPAVEQEAELPLGLAIFLLARGAASLR